MSLSQTSPGVRVLLYLAWPVVLARSSQSVIGFCDALMIAPLGEQALAATTTGALNAFSLAILPVGIALIVQSFAAQLHGKGNLAGARRYAWYGLLLAAVLQVLGIVGVPLAGPALRLFDYEPEVHRLMSQYLVIRLLALGAVVGIEVLGNWFGGLGKTWLHMVAGIVVMVINVALNWVLIEGNLGAPALGVEGAAIASVVATWLGLSFLIVCFAAGWGAKRSPGPLGLRMAEFGRMLRFGIPNGVSWFLEFAAFTLFVNLVVAELGTVVLAAVMVVMQINTVSFMPAFGLTSAGAILVGQAIGGEQRDHVGRIVRRTGLVTALWQCAVGGIYLAVPGVLMSWFAPPTSGGAALYQIGTTLLALSAAWQLFDAVAMTLGEAMRAAGDTAWCMWARLGLAWFFFMPVAFVVVRVLDGGAVAAMLCLLAYLALLAGLFLWRFSSGAWRHIELTGAEPTLV